MQLLELDNFVARLDAASVAAPAQACNCYVAPVVILGNRVRSELNGQAQRASMLAVDAGTVLLDEPDVDLVDCTAWTFWRMVRESLVDGNAIIMTCHSEEFLDASSMWAVVREKWI